MTRSTIQAATATRPRPHPGARLLGALLVCVALLGPPPCPAARPVREHDVKAAFLLNFARFVDWPADAFPAPDSPLVMGIVGDDPFGSVLPRTVEGQKVRGRPIEVRHLDPQAELAACHVLFVSRSLSPEYDRLLKPLRNRPVLTVGETEGFARQGGIIGFAIVDETVRFDINTAVADSTRLKISSKLLAIARSIIKVP